jgi:2-keto-4-pentenoate hydratase/2-oxohepta-3-ene-1,7-dioic acid hydratase in catechol pathway
MNGIVCKEHSIYPSKVVCIGRNYTEHIKELNNEMPEDMVFFIKPNSAITQSLNLPKNNQQCHYEAEISFLIQNNSLSGIGFGLDLTLREVQSQLKKKGLPWERAKAFDGSAVFSEFIPFEYTNENLIIELYINDVLVQKGDVSLMINKPQDIFNEAQSFLSFEEGDILMTGTPSGVGVMNKGDVFVGKIILNNEILVHKKFVVA